METFWIILLVCAAVSGWGYFFFMLWLCKRIGRSTYDIIKAYETTHESAKTVQALQDARHAMEQEANQAMAREIAMLRGVAGAMAKELHKRGFTPPDDSSDADWWKKQ